MNQWKGKPAHCYSAKFRSLVSFRVHKYTWASCVLGPLRSPYCTVFRGDPTQLTHGLNNICRLETLKFISPTQTSLLTSRLVCKCLPDILTWIFTDISTVPCLKLQSHYFSKLLSQPFPSGWRAPPKTQFLKSEGHPEHPTSQIPFTLLSKWIHSLLFPSTAMILVHMIVTSLLDDC